MAVIKNKAAVLKYENNTINIKQFQEVPQPYHLPGFMNVISWSLPFVSEKIASVLRELYVLVDDQAAEELERIEEAKKEKAKEKINGIQTKVKNLGRIMSVYKKIRDEREKTLKYSGFALNGVIPEAIMNMDDEEIEEKISSLGHKALDHGEKRPESDDSFDDRFAQKVNRFVSSQGDARRYHSIGSLLIENEITEMPTIYEDLHSSSGIISSGSVISSLTGSPKSKAEVKINRFVQSSFN